MEKNRRRETATATVLLIGVALLLCLAAPCLSQTPAQYAPNQVILKLQPGSTLADAQRIASANGAVVQKALPIPNTYVLRWEQTRSDSVESKIDSIRLDSSVSRVTPNYIRRPSVIPDDPRYSEQWHYNLINMPAAWDIQKGSANVVVAVVDTGISTTHPDIKDRLVAGIDTADNDADPSIPANGEAHGLHVAGTIAAATGNGLGVAGVCWAGVRIMPVKVFSDLLPWAYDDDIIEGLIWAKDRGAQVVNMSLGGGWPSTSFQDAIDILAAAGVIVVASAGNDFGSVSYPAAFNNVIAVSSVNRSGVLAYYSNFGPQVDVAAPGGEQITSMSDGILSTWWENGQDTYAYLQGTSMASPHVAGVAALLLSNGALPRDIEALLEVYAKPTGVGRPNNQYGWGIIDAHMSLLNPGIISIGDPVSGSKTGSGLAHIKARTFMIYKPSIKVYLGHNVDANNDGIPDDATTPLVDSTNINTYFDDTTGSIELQLAQRDSTNPTLPRPYPVPPKNPLLVDAPLAAGSYKVYITGSRTADLQTLATATVSFTVQAKVLPAGLQLISVPSPLPSSGSGDLDDPRDLTVRFFGLDPATVSTNAFRMARWLPAYGGYAKLNFPDTVSDSRASLFPPDADVHGQGDTANAAPAGIGYWVNLPTSTSVILNGFRDSSKTYNVALSAGWNMIGNPFEFNVDWNAVMVTYQGHTRTIADAAALGWLRPAIYSYGSEGYSFESLPLGMMMPWEGNWIRVLKGSLENHDPLVLSIPPLPSQVGVVTRSSQTLTASKSATGGGKDNWSIKLAVSAAEATDKGNYIGSSTRAIDGYDLADVETPPMLSRFVDLSFPHRDWGENSGAYTRDIRSPVGAGKVWDFEVNTDIPNTDVRLTWPDISSTPKEYNLLLEDVDSSRRVFMRNRSGYTYNSGATPGLRRFKLSVEPASASRLVLTSVNITPTRGSGYTISYSVSRDASVQVRVHNGLHRQLRSLGGQPTRAAGLGSVSWDGREANGSPVTPGQYLVEIIATDADGQVAKTVRPLWIRR